VPESWGIEEEKKAMKNDAVGKRKMPAKVSIHAPIDQDQEEVEEPNVLKSEVLRLSE